MGRLLFFAACGGALLAARGRLPRRFSTRRPTCDCRRGPLAFPPPLHHWRTASLQQRRRPACDFGAPAFSGGLCSGCGLPATVCAGPRSSLGASLLPVDARPPRPAAPVAAYCGFRRPCSSRSGADLLLMHASSPGCPCGGLLRLSAPLLSHARLLARLPLRCPTFSWCSGWCLPLIRASSPGCPRPAAPSGGALSGICALEPRVRCLRSLACRASCWLRPAAGGRVRRSTWVTPRRSVSHRGGTTTDPPARPRAGPPLTAVAGVRQVTTVESPALSSSKLMHLVDLPRSIIYIYTM